MPQPATLIRHPRPDVSEGIFETILVFEGRPVELAPHLARLQRSARELFGEETPETRERLIERAREVGLGRMRVTVSPGQGRLEQEIAVVPFHPEYVFPIGEYTSALRTLPVDRGYGHHKWADRTLLAEAEKAAGSGVVPVLVDEAGTVLEASRANVFLVTGSQLLTPPLDGSILPGVVRAAICEMASGFSVEVEEATVKTDQLYEADEVFLTGSLRGVEPVHELDGKPLRGVGPLTRELATALRERWFGGWL